MDKAELSKLLNAKVRDKLQEGYAITTYAMDAASRDRLKRELKPQSNPVQHDDSAGEAWDEYMVKLKVEESASGSSHAKSLSPPPKALVDISPSPGTSSTGVWKVKRH